MNNFLSNGDLSIRDKQSNWQFDGCQEYSRMCVVAAAEYDVTSVSC